MRRIYQWFYKLLPVSRVAVDDELYLLNESEIAAIRRREQIAIFISALIGAMGVLLLYLPFYYVPEWFPETTITLLGRTFKLPLVFIIYSFVLVVIEILLLSLLNIWCAHEIAVATGFLDYETKQHPDKQNLLMDIGMEKKNKSVLQYGIDPLLGMNRKVLLLWNLLFILKATLTNFLFRFFIQRMAGRYALRAVQDFAGIPIFAFWNAYGTRIILREARIIIMGQNLVEYFVNRLKRDPLPPEADKSVISDTLQFIATSKRDFHQNHFTLTRNIFALMDIHERVGEWNEKAYLFQLKTAESKTRERCIQIILLGMILDGRISKRELESIRILHEEGLISFRPSEMQGFARDFLQGRGVAGMGI
jgi:hypothetical protein